MAMHEIGYLLGLRHSSVVESIMYPAITSRTRKVELHSDDVIGVQYLYGTNLAGIPLIRISCEAQSVSLYIRAWGPSKKPCWTVKGLSPSSASSRQLSIPSTYSSRLVQVFADLKVQSSALSWNR
ncbi:hypothetical protein SO802_022587 [Lithocarpus litseifolius]|uniref:Peptidase M10 metallopeptidase domain-containing protein n=1 Tax=Lithocarpus litseifolius TaxID=425828 RepID=A0AAW2C7D6_9ROSI